MPVIDATEYTAEGLYRVRREGDTRSVEESQLEALVADGWEITAAPAAPDTAPEPTASEEITYTRATTPKVRRTVDTGMVRITEGHVTRWVDPKELPAEHGLRAKFEAQAQEAYEALQSDERARERLAAATQNLAALDEVSVETSAAAVEAEAHAIAAYTAAQAAYIVALGAFCDAATQLQATGAILRRTPRTPEAVRPPSLALLASRDRDVAAVMQHARALMAGDL